MKLCSDARFKDLAATSLAANELLRGLIGRAPRSRLPLDSLDEIVEFIETPDEFSAVEMLIADLMVGADDADSYEQHKARTRERQARIAAAGREIGPLPAVENPTRKEQAAFDLRLHFETYHPTSFPLGWSKDHLKVIKKMQRTILHGGVYALAMPRGSGKTTMAVRAAIWAWLNGHHRYVVVICANKVHAAKVLAGIQFELEMNPLLFADYPEVCYPIRCLERIYNRSKGQRLGGIATRMTWTGQQLVLPTVAGSKASGAVLQIAGLKGSDIRGCQFVAPDLSIWRPSLVLADDPQTRESARSVLQNDEREQLLKADVLGMAGPEQAISLVATMTVVEEGDLACSLLNRERNPEFRGERMKMLYSFPTRMDLWEQYQQIRRDCLAGEDDLDDDDANFNIFEAADSFYRKHRKAMDNGAVVAWEHRHPGCLSAIQYAMHLFFRDATAFYSEYQNDPAKGKETDDEFLTSDQIAINVNNLERLQIPHTCTMLTAHVDVQHKLFYYVLCAWEQNFTGYVIDYGAFPEQRTSVFTAKKARPTLRQKFPGTNLEGAWWAGLNAMADQLLRREYSRDDGQDIDVVCCLVDAGDGAGSGETVKKWCRYNDHKAITHAAIGFSMSAKRAPISMHRRRAGEKRGGEWRMTAGKFGRHCLYDPNVYKTLAHRRIATPQGQPGSLTLYGKDDGRPVRHDFYAHQMTTEVRARVRNEKINRVIDLWTLKPGESENHWLDNTAGCVLAAAMHGCSTTPTVQKTRRKRPTNYEVKV